MISPYESYVYAYPHKTAYRPLDPRPDLTEVWRGEKAGSFYAHIPFCEMRCGFCNLFTRTGAPEELVAAFLDALERETLALSDAVDPAFTTAAIGGGTPTYLSPFELSRLFDITGKLAPYGTIPLSVETSPATATADRLAVLKERGATRISIGVQSFIDEEARSAVRPQKRAEVEQALDAIRSTGFPILNIDLIYGIDGQTAESWLHSLKTALHWAPEELYLYPLYVRPLTGLGKIGRDWDDQRMELYREGRDFLLSQGYEQVSMRMFRLPGTGTSTDYCCQTDGMASVGCGARSYTSTLHYSHEYAVGARHVRTIIDDYVRRDDFTQALIGFTVPEPEQRRRHTIQSLLQKDGLDLGLYRDRFGADPDVTAVPDHWLVRDDRTLRLTDEGLAHSDWVGPALFSDEVRTLMAANHAR
ncbi:STM4012 family radical SAM protein [Herbidospora mongoliensis]|uniref:STM4012 family radical SAM protein n=1 Tax=Herbidospora mongoliensis TaxID=688067 RepID=UPI00082C9D8B|nr:STM4012 family radical SAM protein [Herbidospora mongoliensis]